MDDMNEEFFNVLFEEYDRLLDRCQAVRIIAEEGSSLDRFVDHIEGEVESLQVTLSNHVHKLHD